MCGNPKLTDDSYDLCVLWVSIDPGKEQCSFLGLRPVTLAIKEQCVLFL